MGIAPAEPGSAISWEPSGSASAFGRYHQAKLLIPEGAHQLLNEGSGVVRLLALSTHGQPDIVVYPDSEKLGVAERNPNGAGLHKIFRSSDSVDYWDGESRRRSP